MPKNLSVRLKQQGLVFQTSILIYFAKTKVFYHLIILLINSGYTSNLSYSCSRISWIGPHGSVSLHEAVVSSDLGDEGCGGFGCPWPLGVLKVDAV